MPVRNKIRIYETAIWGSIIVSLGLGAFGAYLTYKQYDDMDLRLYVAERVYSSNLATKLRSEIEEREKETFESIKAFAHGAHEAPTLPPGTPEAFFGLPFRIRTNGEIEGLGQPLRTSPPPPRETEAPPAEYRQAVRLSNSRAPIKRKIKALEAASRRAGLPQAWRIRANTQLAALYSRYDQPAAAESIYAGMLESAPGALANISWPTPAQLSLARAATLSELNRKAEVPGVLTHGLSFLYSGSKKNGFAKRESYLQGSIQLLRGLDLPPPKELKEAIKELEKRKPIVRAVKHVRDVSLPRELSRRSSTSSRRWSWSSIENNLAVVWRPTPSAITTAGIKTAGVVVDVERLLRALNREVRALDEEMSGLGSSGSHRVALRNGMEAAFSRRGSDPARKMVTFLPDNSLAGDLLPFSIGLPRTEWEERLGTARRPFVIAGLLSAILGLTLACGLLVIRRTMRREMKLARMKTEFVANVSHELKTPLSLIKLCSETLQFDRVSGEEKRQEYFEVINRESDRLSHLIGNVLNFSKIDAGKKNYALKKVDLGPLLNQTLDAYFLQIKEQEFTCRRDIPDSLPAILADEEAVAQAFINLLQNAVRYSPEKGELIVRAWSDEKSLLVSVADGGIGIAEDEQQRIWDDYYRTAEARALGTRGSGLGLSLVSHIMKAHMGETRLVSVPGEGSEFTLVFPLEAETQLEHENDR